MIAVLYVICAVLVAARVLGVLSIHGHKHETILQSNVMDFDGWEATTMAVVIACVTGAGWPLALLVLAVWWLWRKGLGAGVRWLVWKSIDRYVVPKQILRRMNGGSNAP